MRHRMMAHERKGNAMRLSTTLLLISVVTVAGAAPAAAQEEQNVLRENAMMYVDSLGRMSQWKAGQGSHARMMRMGRPLPAGTIVYHSGGRLYMAMNRKMTGGKRLVEMFRADPPLH